MKTRTETRKETRFMYLQGSLFQGRAISQKILFALFSSISHIFKNQGGLPLPGTGGSGLTAPVSEPGNTHYFLLPEPITP